MEIGRGKRKASKRTTASTNSYDYSVMLWLCLGYYRYRMFIITGHVRDVYFRYARAGTLSKQTVD